MNGDVSLSHIPIEVWVEVFKKLDGPSLWSCQHVCSIWKMEIINMTLSNKLNGRGLDCKRLTYAGDALEHRRAIRNTISVQCSEDTLLVGVYSYTVNDKDLLDETVVGTFDRITTTLTVWHQKQLVAQKVKITTTKEARAAVKRPGHVPNMGFIALEESIILNSNEIYDVELNLLPTDVVNHYSGWPVTRTGADVWTCWGNSGKAVVNVAGVDMTFGTSTRGGRDCLREGQIPRLVVWPLEASKWSPVIMEDEVAVEEEKGDACLERSLDWDGLSLTLNVCQHPHSDAISAHFCTRGLHKN